MQIAGSLTYTTLLSLVPLFAIVVALMSALPFFEGVMVDIKIFLLLNLVPEIAYKIITVYMEQFADNAGKLTVFGLGALLLMALAMLFTVDRSFNAIWRSHRVRPLWMSVLGYTVLIGLAPLMLGAGMTITSYLVAFSLQAASTLPFVDIMVLKLLSVAGSAVTFFLVYRIVPCRHVPVVHALIGALVAAVLFEAMKQLFGVYVSMVPTYDVVYGAFAAIPLFLLWLFMSWLVILFGAEVTAALPQWRRSAWRRAGVAQANLHDGLLLMRALLAATADGRTLTLAEMKREVAVPIDRLEDMLHGLRARGVVVRPRGFAGQYSLSPEAMELTLADVYRLFVVRDTGADDLQDTEFAPVFAEIEAALDSGLRRRLSDVLAPLRKD